MVSRFFNHALPAELGRAGEAVREGMSVTDGVFRVCLIHFRSYRGKWCEAEAEHR